MRIKLTLSYDGTHFCGWQIQPNGRSVQADLQDAIFSLTAKQVKVTGSGRTDAGVHANGQIAHFDIEDCSIPPESFAKALNTRLPQDVKVIQSQLIDDGFDARKSAKRKTYTYSLYVSQTELPLKERFAVRLDKLPDLQKMELGAKEFVGEHDFKCFNASGGGAKTTVRTIYNIEIIDSQEELKIRVSGNGFLYKMVRSLAGVLLLVGYGKLSLEDCEKILQEKRRSEKIKTLPAKGLTLFSVSYK